MIYPGSLIRWGALGAVVLLVRAIVREAQEERGTVTLLPPTRDKFRSGSPTRSASGSEMSGLPPEWDEVNEATDESFPAGDPPAR
jgi:hypothetical protein